MSGAARRLTWRDLARLPEDGLQYELLRGNLFMTPPAGTRHQRVELEIAVLLRDWVRPRRLGHVLTDAGVRLSESTFFEPDVVFVASARRSILREPYLAGAPDLVVEVLSPATAAMDRGPKLKACRAHGVREYWIADPAARRFEVHDFLQGRRRRPRGPFECAVLSGLIVDPGALFSVLDE